MYQSDVDDVIDIPAVARPLRILMMAVWLVMLVQAKAKKGFPRQLLISFIMSTCIES